MVFGRAEALNYLEELSECTTERYKWRRQFHLYYRFNGLNRALGMSMQALAIICANKDATKNPPLPVKNKKVRKQNGIPSFNQMRRDTKR